MANIDDFKKETKEYSQVSARISKRLKDNISEFAEKNNITRSRTIHFILADYFDRDTSPVPNISDSKIDYLESQIIKIQEEKKEEINDIRLGLMNSINMFCRKHDIQDDVIKDLIQYINNNTKNIFKENRD